MVSRGDELGRWSFCFPNEQFRLQDVQRESLWPEGSIYKSHRWLYGILKTNGLYRSISRNSRDTGYEQIDFSKVRTDLISLSTFHPLSTGKCQEAKVKW